MVRTSLDSYDKRPEEMDVYLSNYGWHFNRKMFEYAVSHMRKKDKDNKLKRIISFGKEEVDQILKKYNIELDNNVLYDYVYVANMCKADFLHSSIVDEQHLAMYIKDVIDDDDAYDGMIFNRWYADMCKKGIGIDWEECL